MSGQMTSTLETLSNFHPLPFSCKLELHTHNSLVREKTIVSHIRVILIDHGNLTSP